jgi:plasmid stability protein
MEPYRNHDGRLSIMNFTLKNIPNDIYEKIKIRAERNQRSVNGEIISILSETTRPRSKNAVEILARADALRARTKGFLTDEFLRKAKRDGLP